MLLIDLLLVGWMTTRHHCVSMVCCLTTVMIIYRDVDRNMYLNVVLAVDRTVVRTNEIIMG